MKNSIITIVLFFALGITQPIIAQDFFFTQFDQAPLYINPALTGSFDGNHRVNATYRGQTFSGFSGTEKTFSLSYDTKFNLKNGSSLGIVINGLSNKAGASEFGSQHANLLLSFAHQIIKDATSYHSFGIGLGLGNSKRSIRTGDFRWPSQHNDNGGFDAIDPPGEILDGIDLNYADISAGLNWRYVITANASIQLGFAIHHLNRANVSFLGNPDVVLNTNTIFHLGGEFGIGNSFSLLPGIIYSSQGIYDISFLGTDFKKTLNPSCLVKSFQIGFWVRNISYDVISITHAYVINPSIEIGNLNLGLSFDFLQSDFLSTKDGFFEVTAGYIIGKGKRAYY